jgi:hypothetical protein
VRRAVAGVLALGLIGALAPPSMHVTMTARAIVVDDAGHVVSTATICPGFAFDALGVGGPQFSPDRHWVLVDVRGPFEPGNVPRNHALVQVTTGAVVLSADFPRYLGVPSSLDPIAWASGDRATLRYKDGSTATIKEPLLHALPATRCTPSS